MLKTIVVLNLVFINIILIFLTIQLSNAASGNIGDDKQRPLKAEFCNLSAFSFKMDDDQSALFWNIVYRKRPEAFKKFVKASVNYCFKDVKSDGLAQFNIEKIDDVLNKIFAWYQSPDLAKKPDDNGAGFRRVQESLASFTVEHIIHAFADQSNQELMNREKFVGSKQQQQMGSKKAEKFHIFDVGAGDGNFSEILLRAFLVEGYDADMMTIDLKGDKLEWNAQQQVIQQNLNGVNDLKDKFTKRDYDGTNLGEIIQEELLKKNKVNKQKGILKERIAVTFNHSFHHWQTSKLQEETMRQLGEILPIGSVVFFKEHYCLMDDLQLTMIHAIFEAKGEMKKLLAKRGKLNAADSGKDEQNERKWEEEKKQLRNHVNAYLRTTPHNYLSPLRLHQLMTAAGFELDCHTPEMDNHLNRTVYYVYRKRANYDSETLAIEKQRFRSIDELQTHMTLRCMKKAIFVSKKDRKNAPGIVWQTGNNYTMGDDEDAVKLKMNGQSAKGNDKK